MQPKQHDWPEMLYGCALGAAIIATLAFITTHAQAAAAAPANSKPVCSISITTSMERDVSFWRVGQDVLHPTFGTGVIINAEGRGADARVQVNFRSGGMKWLALEYARLNQITGHNVSMCLDLLESSGNRSAPTAEHEREQQKVARKQREAEDGKRRAEAAARAAQSKLIDDWRARIQNSIKGGVVVPPNIEGNPEARFEVTLLPGGEILNTKLTKSSGN